MRTRNALTRLAAVAPAAEPLIDSGEEDRILERILASPRPTARRRPLTLVFAAVAVLAAVAAVAALELGRGANAPTRPTGHHHVALSGARIELAGYRFKTPAGFEPAMSGCPSVATPDPGTPTPALDGFAVAASADGGCIGLAILASWTAPADAQAMSVGSYDGFLVPGDPMEALVVRIPGSQGDHYLVLTAHGLSVAQLVAMAESGLANIPFAPTTTTGTEGG